MSGERYEMAGKVVLVTGAARGIGFETAKEAHRRGASVVLADLEAGAAERAARAVGPRAAGVAADASDREACEAAVRAAVDRFGRLDVAVANAGITPTNTTTRMVGREEWERVVEVNLMGVWRTVRAALPQVVANRGQVLLVSSSYAFLNGVVNSAYATAKAGVEALGRSLRTELKPLGASATVAYFGFIRTEMVREAFEDPTVDRMRKEAFPGFLTRQVPVAKAGRAVVDGLERRSPRVVVPFEYRVMLHLRGLLGPLMDLKLERDPRVAEIVREAERIHPAAPEVTVEFQR